MASGKSRALRIAAARKERRLRSYDSISRAADEMGLDGEPLTPGEVVWAGGLAMFWALLIVVGIVAFAEDGGSRDRVGEIAERADPEIGPGRAGK